jgi:hypothetical protein
MKKLVLIAALVLSAGAAQAMNCSPSLGGYNCEPGLNDSPNSGFHTGQGLGGSFSTEPNNFDLNPYRYANPHRNQWNNDSD